MVWAASAYLLVDAKPLLDLKHYSPWHVLESQQTTYNSDAEGILMMQPCHNLPAVLECDGLCWRCVLECENYVSKCTMGEDMFLESDYPWPCPNEDHKPPTHPNHTHSYTHREFHLLSPPDPGTLQKLEQITPLCACSSFDCCYIQLGFQVASCAHSTLWDRAQCTTHGDYYQSLQRPACGSSPLQIGLPWFLSSPEHSKHPFPPTITAVNHSDSVVHSLSL